MPELREINPLKLIRNVLLAILSFGWCIPLSGGIMEICLWLYQALQPGKIEQGGKDFYLELRMNAGFMELGLHWLGLVIAFWAFVLANKFWPIKKKPKDS